MEILALIALTYGFCNIVVYNTIPAWEKFTNFLFKVSPKYLYKILNCMMCLPTWVGFGLSYLFITLGLPTFSPFTSLGVEIMWLAIFFDGVLLSGTTWFLHTIQEAIERTNQKDG